MGQFPACILPDGKSGALDYAFGLEDSGESPKGHGTDDSHQGFFVIEKRAKTVDSGSDFSGSGQKCPDKRCTEREFLYPHHQNGKKHQISADYDHCLTSGGDGIFQRECFCRVRGGIFGRGCIAGIDVIKVPGSERERQDGQVQAGKQKDRRRRSGKLGPHIAQKEHGAWMVAYGEQVGGFFFADGFLPAEVGAHFCPQRIAAQEAA